MMNRSAALSATFCLTVLVHTCCGIPWAKEVSDTPKGANAPLEPPGGCRLPEPPEFGSYTTPVCQFNNKSGECKQVPGTLVAQNWVLIFKCNKGYFVKESPDNLYAFCVAGNWLPQIPTCTSKIGSTVSKHENQVCGKRNVKGETIDLKSVNEPSTLEFPWHAGVYLKNNLIQWTQVCGGTLISPHIVMTAAHCVFSEPNKKFIKPSEVKVGLGKYYREWSHDEPGAVKADVQIIQASPRYYGQMTSYAKDVALLGLTRSVSNSNIMPACIDWNHKFTIKPGTLGTVAKWGKTDDGRPSDVLSYIQLPYVDYEHCVFEAPLHLQHYITTDKFCAGYSNGTGGEPGDGGGGLTFVQNGLHYAYGIMSTKIKYVYGVKDTKLKGPKSLTTFVNVSNLEVLNLLQEAKRVIDEKHVET